MLQYSKEQSELYRKMYDAMSKQKMPESNEEGIQRYLALLSSVRVLTVSRSWSIITFYRVVDDDEKYAFLMESTSIDYTTERNCLVTKVLS